MIAQRLKLSESTVSRALNDYQDIALETKELVRKTAAELGYVPNMHARRLASGKADTIAFVMPRTDGQLNAAFLGESCRRAHRATFIMTPTAGLLPNSLAARK
tara:strand:+ start:203 stop:511 length:309 start_codon:yes stop_codon:yes gene_type:complete